VSVEAHIILVATADPTRPSCSPPSPEEEAYAYYELDEAEPLPQPPRRQLHSLVPGHQALFRGRRLLAATCIYSKTNNYLHSSSAGYVKYGSGFVSSAACCVKCFR
jgi:hypothetical protein